MTNPRLPSLHPSHPHRFTKDQKKGGMGPPCGPAAGAQYDFRRLGAHEWLGLRLALAIPCQQILFQAIAGQCTTWLSDPAYGGYRDNDGAYALDFLLSLSWGTSRAAL